MHILLFDNMINIKNLDSNKIKIDKNILIFYTGYVTVKDQRYVKNKLSRKKGYFEESNGNKYLTLVPT